MKEFREQIVAKIEAKETSTQKLRAKPVNLQNQIEMFEESIVKKKDEIKKLEKLVERSKESTEVAANDLAVRESEIDHMNEILERFDLADKERGDLSIWLTAKLAEDAAEEWYPGRISPLDTDEEFAEKKKRKLYLDDLIEACLSDVRKIYYSRGEVSGFNVKGRKGV